MSRISAETLDLSRFPAPLAIRGIDAGQIYSERIQRLKSELEAAGIPFDVDRLVANPAALIERVETYRELLVLGAINDAVKAGLVAFATGADLEHLGAFYGLSRRELAPAAGTTPAVLESDEELRRRVLLAPEAFATAGTAGGYLFHTLNADTRVLNADVWSPARGEVAVAIQARDGGAAASDDLVASVRAHLHRDDIRPLTDGVSVRSVSIHPYSIAVTVFVRSGPDQSTVKAAVLASLTNMVAARQVPARDVPISAVIAAASVGPVDRVVVHSLAADVVMGNGELAVCTGISVEVETHDG